jgi:hypothetical protein
MQEHKGKAKFCLKYWNFFDGLKSPSSVDRYNGPGWGMGGVSDEDWGGSRYDWWRWQCDRVTWCLGPFSLVSSSILNLSFLSLSESDFALPPLLSGLCPGTPSHCGDGGGFDTLTRPNRELKPPTNHREFTQKPYEIFFPKPNQLQLKPYSFSTETFYFETLATTQ